MTRSHVNPASSVKKDVCYRLWVYKTHYEKPLETRHPCTMTRKNEGLHLLDVVRVKWFFIPQTTGTPTFPDILPQTSPVSWNVLVLGQILTRILFTHLRGCHPTLKSATTSTIRTCACVCVCVCVCSSVTVVAQDLHTTTHGSAKSNMDWTTGPFLRHLATCQSCPSEQCTPLKKTAHRAVIRFLSQNAWNWLKNHRTTHHYELPYE
jgi:hypothetical protein